MARFERCRKVSIVAKTLSAIIGIILCFNIEEFIENCQLVDQTSTRDWTLFLLGCLMLVFLIILQIVLKCLMKDIEDDSK